MSWFSRLIAAFRRQDRLHKASWPTREPRGPITMPRTTLIEDWRALGKSAKPASVVPFRKQAR